VVGYTTAGADDQGRNDALTLPSTAVETDDEVESELSEHAGSSEHQPHSDDDDEHRLTDDDDRLCGRHRCEAGRGHCQPTRDGSLCICVEGYYGPDCQQRTQFTALFLSITFQSNVSETEQDRDIVYIY